MYFLIFALGCIELYGTITVAAEPFKWVPFNKGQIPSNAISAGIENYEKVYVAMAFYNRALHSGKLINKRTYLEFVLNNLIITQSDKLWILTTDAPQVFEWVQVKFDNIILPRTNIQPINIDILAHKYVARAGKKVQTVGTLECEAHLSKCQPLGAVNKYGNVEIFTEFELLVHPQ